MAALTLRSTKGSILTVAELDANYNNLNAESGQKVSAANPTFTGVVNFSDVQGIAPTSLSYPAIRPSLLLDFINSHTLDPRITFTRTSSATRTNTRGLLETVGTKVPRFDYDPVTDALKGLLIEEQRTNLLTYSEQLDNAAWTKVNITAVPGNVTAPNGTNTAQLVTRGTGSSAYIGNSGGAGAAGTYTLSVYAKASTISGALGIRIQGTYPNRGDALFNLNTGVVLSSGVSAFGTATNVSASISAQGNGWYRCFVTVTLSDTLTTTVISPCETTVVLGGFEGSSAIASNCLLWGAQLELGAFGTSYTPSTVTHTGRASTATYIDATGIIQTAASGAARYQYNLLNLNASPALLLEAAATNLITDSAFNTSNWTVVGSGLTNAAITAPNGVVEADKLTETASTSEHYVRQIRTTSITAGAVHTMSVYVKAAERNAVTLRILDNTNYSNVVVLNISSISTGTILNAYAVGTATYINSSITAMPNSWFRITLTGIASPTTTALMIIINAQDAALSGSYLGTAGSGIYIWGAQLEAGTYATSYIPTTSGSGAVTRAADTSTSAQTTRAADVAVLQGVNFSNWYNPVEGTVVAIGQMLSVSGPVSRSIFDITDGSTVNRINGRLFTAGTGDAATVRSGGVTQFQLASANNTTTAVKTFAIAYKASDFAVTSNGSVPITQASGAVAVGVNQLQLGGAIGSSEILCGYIRRIAYYPRRLSNTELQALTA